MRLLAVALRGTLNLRTRTAMPASTPMQREAVALVLVAVLPVALMGLATLRLRLAAGDE